MFALKTSGQAVELLAPRRLATGITQKGNFKPTANSHLFKEKAVLFLNAWCIRTLYINKCFI